MMIDDPSPWDLKTWSFMHLSDLIEQNHRNVNRRVNLMHGFERFRCARITIFGIESTYCIRKCQLGFPLSGEWHRFMCHLQRCPV